MMDNNEGDQIIIQQLQGENMFKKCYIKDKWREMYICFVYILRDFTI